MVKRKGERTDRAKNRSHPFQVEIVIPEGGLGNAMNFLHAGASQWGYEMVGVRGDRSLVRWCFMTRDHADRFAADFGGRRVDIASDAWR
jgi:hypothetical protein